MFGVCLITIVLSHYLVLSQSILPFQKIMCGGINTSVGFSGKEGLFAIVALCPMLANVVYIFFFCHIAMLGIVAITTRSHNRFVYNIAMRHIPNRCIGRKILHILHIGYVKYHAFLIVFKTLTGKFWHQCIKQIECRINIVVIGPWFKL